MHACIRIVELRPPVSHGNNAGWAPVTGEGWMVHNGTDER